MVNPIPDRYHTVTPYLVGQGLSKLIEFLKKAFDAEVIEKHEGPKGAVMHAEVKIGDSVIMMGEPKDGKPMPTMLYLYVEDTGAVYKKAVEAGGESIQEPTNQFYGDRNAAVKGPCGNQWWIATHVEDVSPEEMAKRAKAAGK